MLEGLAATAVALWHLGVSASAVIACVSSDDGLLQTRTAILARYIVQIIFIAVVAVWLPFWVYMQETTLEPPHGLRWLAAVWGAFLASSITSYIAHLREPAMLLALICSLTCSAVPLFSTMHLGQQVQNDQRRLSRWRIQMKVLRDSLQEWANSVPGLQDCTQKDLGASMFRAAVECETAEALATIMSLVQAGNRLNTADLFTTNLAPIRVLGARHLGSCTQGTVSPKSYQREKRWLSSEDVEGILGQLQHATTITAVHTACESLLHLQETQVVSARLTRIDADDQGHSSRDKHVLGSVLTSSRGWQRLPLAIASFPEKVFVHCFSFKDTRTTRLLLGVSGGLVAVCLAVLTRTMSVSLAQSVNTYGQFRESGSLLFTFSLCEFYAWGCFLRLLLAGHEIKFFQSAWRKARNEARNKSRQEWFPIEAGLDAFVVTLVLCIRFGFYGRPHPSFDEAKQHDVLKPLWIPAIIHSAYCFKALANSLFAAKVIRRYTFVSVSVMYGLIVFAMPGCFILSACAACAHLQKLEAVTNTATTILDGLFASVSIFMLITAYRHNYRTQHKLKSDSQLNPLRMRGAAHTRSPAFIAAFDAQLFGILAVCTAALLDDAASNAVAYAFIYFSTSHARGTIQNNNEAFHTAVVSNRAQQYGQNALYRIVASSNAILAESESSPGVHDATILLHLHAEALLMQFMQSVRIDMYYTPITVRVVVDSLLDRLAVDWEKEGLVVLLDKRRVDFPAVLMQELQEHPQAFLSTTCEAINRAATDIIMFKSELEAPKLVIKPFLRKVGRGRSALRVAVCQKIRGVTSDDLDHFSMAVPHHADISQRRWGPFLSCARKLNTAAGEGAWLCGSVCTASASLGYADSGGAYVISVDTPISRACAEHPDLEHKAEVRTLRMQAAVPAHKTCVCSLLAPQHLNIGEPAIAPGIERVAIYTQSGVGGCRIATADTLAGCPTPAASDFEEEIHESTHSSPTSKWTATTLSSESIVDGDEGAHGPQRQLPSRLAWDSAKAPQNKSPPQATNRSIEYRLATLPPAIKRLSSFAMQLNDLDREHLEDGADKALQGEQLLQASGRTSWQPHSA